MSKFEYEVVGKIGSMALIRKEDNDIDYNIFSNLGAELRPGMIWVSSGAVEIGRLDYIKRNGKELTGDIEDIKTDYAAQGQAIRFEVEQVRPTGLGAGGMRAVKLSGRRDRVVGAGIADDRARVWVCTDTGVAKSTAVTEYPTQGRGGQGVITIRLPKDAQGLAAATVGRPDDNIVVVTNRGKAKYMRVSLAPQGGRNTKGDYVISMTRVNEAVSGVVRFEPRIEPVVDDADQTEGTAAEEEGEEIA